MRWASTGPAIHASFSQKHSLANHADSLVVPDHLLHPYSRSHNRREKRKAKNHLIGGELDVIASALSEAIGEEPAIKHLDKKGKEITKDPQELKEERRRREAEKGKIGEGKGRTMNETKRRKQM